MPAQAADSSAEPKPHPAHLLRLSTETLLFNHARAGVLYTRRVTLTNPLPTPVEVTIKPGNPERYTIEPASLTIGARGTDVVEVRLKMTTLPVPRRPGGAGSAGAGGPVKDSFTIRSNFGVQRFFAMLTPAAHPPPGRTATADSAATDVASSAEAAIEPPASAAAESGYDDAMTHSAGLPAGQDAWPWPAQPPDTPLLDAALVPGASSIGRADVFEQLQQLDESNQALQREVAVTAAELSQSRAEAEQLSAQQHALVEEHAAPDLRRLVQRMREEDEAKSARVLAVLHAKDAEIAQLLGVVEELQHAAEERALELQQRDERGALAAEQVEGVRREQGEATRSLHAAEERIRELAAQVIASRRAADGLGPTPDGRRMAT